jgi:hypothetical protein
MTATFWAIPILIIANMWPVYSQSPFSFGDFLAQYAPGLFVSGKSSRVNALEANARTSLWAYSRAVIKALRKAAMALKARITSVPVPLFTFDDLFEDDNAGERGLFTNKSPYPVERTRKYLSSTNTRAYRCSSAPPRWTVLSRAITAVETRDHEWRTRLRCRRPAPCRPA